MTGTVHPEPPHRRLDPPSLPPPKGYSNGVLAAKGRTLYLAGQVGWDREERFAVGLPAQVDRALENLVAVLAAAGGAPEHLVSMRIYTRSVEAWRAEGKAIGAAWRKHLGRWFPAMTLVEVARLYDAPALVEIESVAVLPD
ncbi:MAG: RidA family protein [Planctomycetes bacterium]|nr:RidA family protein [Planctomycetota bacterium]